MLEALSALADTPLPAILAIGGILFLLLAITPIKGIVVGRPSPQRQKLSGIIGSVLLVASIALYLIPPQELPPAPSIVSTENLPSPAIANTITPTAVQPVVVDTVAPTLAPILNIEDGCINSQTWTPYQGESHTKDQNGCWQLLDWGISAQRGGLLLYVRQPPNDEAHGIYASIPQNVVIKFTFQAEKLATSENARITNIAFGIVPSDVPDLSKGIVYLFQAETIGQDFLFLKISEPGQKQKYLLPHYELGVPHTVKFQVDNLLLAISIDGDDKVAEPRSIPFSQRAFWIGYTVPSGGFLSVQISDISIQPK